MSRVATEGIDYTNKDYQAFREMMVSYLTSKFPEYDTSQTDAGIVILEGASKALDILSMYNDITANDVILDTTQDRGIAVIISKMLGHIPSNSTGSKLKQIFVLSKAQTKDKVISRGTVVYTPKTPDEESVYFVTTEDLTIPAGALGDEKDESGNYLYEVNVEQGIQVEDDILGSSDGVSDYQEFVCTYRKVIVDSLEVYVNEGSGYVLWEQVDTFINSNSKSNHYTVSVDEFDKCTITFGNGVMGKIPLSYNNGIIADYRTGGGEIGNVKAKTITEVQSSISFLDYTTNPKEPYELGADKESLKEIKELAPKAFKTQERAVARGDFADMIRLKFNKYIRFTNDIATAGSLTIYTYYLMRDSYTMTDSLKSEILEYMSEHKVIGSTIELVEYKEKVVNINATLKIFNDYDRDTIKGLVSSAVTSYFQKGNFDFGDELILSELESTIVNGIDGVRSFRINTPSEDIKSEEDEIIVLGTFEPEVIGGIV